jgi:peptidoglycan/LPS O-acetylase OafA/YrhL
MGRFSAINYLGKISYGLYIYHELVILLSAKLFHFYRIGQPFGLTVLHTAITLMVTVLVAHTSFRYFEKYFLKLKDSHKMGRNRVNKVKATP